MKCQEKRRVFADELRSPSNLKGAMALAWDDGYGFLVLPLKSSANFDSFEKRNKSPAPTIHHSSFRFHRKALVRFNLHSVRLNGIYSKSSKIEVRTKRTLHLNVSKSQEARAGEDQEEVCEQKDMLDSGNKSRNSGQGMSSKVEEKSGPGNSILSFLCPLLKIIGERDPTKPRNTFLEVATSGLASLARLPWGSKVRPEIASVKSSKKQPLQLFQLYEFEACPFCRRVREALTELDLSAEVYPCPKGSLRHRPYVLNVGGKEQFPFFVDPNKGVALYESSDIVHYLFQEYGGVKPSGGLLESTLITGWVPTILRVGRGMTLWKDSSSQAPEKMLTLYSYENNQFARIVREALCELEIPYILRNVGKGSRCSTELLQIAGSTKVPFLVDPNTGVSMAESSDIVKYLFERYAA